MSKKILIILFLFAVVLLGIDGIYYLGTKNQVSISNLTSLFSRDTKAGSIFEVNYPPTAKPILIEILNSSLNEITKAQAEQLANKGEITAISLNNPIIDESTKKKFEELSKTKYTSGQMSSIPVLGGKYVALQDSSIIMLNNKKTFLINFSDTSRLWVKNNNKLQVISAYLPVLANTGVFSNYVKQDDLVLAVYVKPINNKIEAKYLMVFK